MTIALSVYVSLWLELTCLFKIIYLKLFPNGNPLAGHLCTEYYFQDKNLMNKLH
jgi:hypothetical protein